MFPFLMLLLFVCFPGITKLEAMSKPRPNYLSSSKSVCRGQTNVSAKYCYPILREPFLCIFLISHQKGVTSYFYTQFSSTSFHSICGTIRKPVLPREMKRMTILCDHKIVVFVQNIFQANSIFREWAWPLSRLAFQPYIPSWKHFGILSQTYF